MNTYDSTIKVQAKFIGKNGSLGFETGSTYILTMMHEKATIMYIETPKGICPYETFVDFLDNWTDIKKV